MEPLTLTAGAIATLVLVKATEKASEKLGELVVDKAGKLLSLLKSKSPSTATDIELSQQQPLDYNKAVRELEEATEDPEIAKAVKEVDTAVKAEPRIAKLVKDQLNTLKSGSSSASNYTNVAKQQVNTPQGHGASVSIKKQTNYN
jgi:hypothetical protein